MAQQPSIPKGTRDFGPQETARRQYIFSTIKDVFRLFGYRQIETPAMENLSTLLGKYGDEGDKLLFKILNSGDYLKSLDRVELENGNIPKVTNSISEKGLRYDLTVPFARFVVQNRNNIKFPFKRFQIQPVWRADRPQKGRYREFYQCDADIVGSDSLWNEVELLQMIDRVFDKFGINVLIKLNNRKILSGIAEKMGVAEQITDVTVAIDKIDKIGIENVVEELKSKGLTEKAINILRPLLELKGSNDEKLSFLKDFLKDSAIGLKGIDEIETVINRNNSLGLNCGIELDVSLARGLNYYTGTIIEVKACDVEIGSISGGGRYDNLTGIFGLPDVSGVGVSFGADRIYDVLWQLNLFPEELGESVKIIFVNFGEEEALASARYIKELREAGISAELYPDAAKMKKQMGYADNEKIPFVAIIGETELKEGKINVKNMLTGQQANYYIKDLIKEIKSQS